MAMLVLAGVLWVSLHPALDLHPTVFRFFVFATVMMALLRAPFRYSATLPVAVKQHAEELIQMREEDLCLFAPRVIRC